MNRLMDTLSFQKPTFHGGWKGQLYGNDGKRYIDLFGDSGAASMGAHSPEHINLYHDMVHAGGFVTHCPSIHGTRRRVEASEMLCNATAMDRVFWSTSGAESVEAAIKIARKVQSPRGRHVVYAHEGDFHGRTYGAMAASMTKAGYHRYGFYPMAGGFKSYEKLDDIDWDEAAAVMICPMFCDHDFREYPREYLRELRAKCWKNDVALIFDEVQTGTGRTGEFTYSQTIGIRPDIMCIAKGIGMGVPVGVTLANGKYGDTLSPGSHFSTFGGNGLQANAVYHFLKWYEGPGKLHIAKQSELLRPELERVFGGIRGLGLALAVDVGDAQTLRQRALERGVILGVFREGRAPVRITPPLNIEGDEIMSAVIALALALKGGE